ncbi:sodium/glutamate symporter, partial [uncultured Bilophila sp.]
MEKSFLPYLMAFMWMSFLLLVGVWLRAKVRFFQTYLVPAGIIAGTVGFALINLGLIGYPSPEGWVTLQGGDFGMVSFHLFSFGFGIIGLGCFSRHTKGRSLTLIKGALWIDLLFWMFYGLQATVGFGVTELYARLTGSDITTATGFLAGFGFAFGPGQALSVGMSWQNDYGLADCISMALAYAAAGFMVANFVGVPLANWGLRKGYATHGAKELSPDFLSGLRTPDKQVSACHLTTHNGNVDTFALHFAVACTVYGLGW